MACFVFRPLPRASSSFWILAVQLTSFSIVSIVASADSTDTPTTNYLLFRVPELFNRMAPPEPTKLDSRVADSGFMRTA